MIHGCAKNYLFSFLIIITYTLQSAALSTLNSTIDFNSMPDEIIQYNLINTFLEQITKENDLDALKGIYNLGITQKRLYVLILQQPSARQFNKNLLQRLCSEYIPNKNMLEEYKKLFKNTKQNNIDYWGPGGYVNELYNQTDTFFRWTSACTGDVMILWNKICKKGYFNPNIEWTLPVIHFQEQYNIELTVTARALSQAILLKNSRLFAGLLRVGGNITITELFCSCIVEQTEEIGKIRNYIVSCATDILSKAAAQLYEVITRDQRIEKTFLYTQMYDVIKKTLTCAQQRGKAQISFTSLREQLITSFFDIKGIDMSNPIKIQEGLVGNVTHQTAFFRLWDVLRSYKIIQKDQKNLLALVQVYEKMYNDRFCALLYPQIARNYSAIFKQLTGYIQESEIKG